MAEQTEMLVLTPARGLPALGRALGRGWTAAVAVALASVSLLTSVSLLGAWALRGEARTASVPELAAALIGLAFGSRVAIRPSPAGAPLPDEMATYLTFRPLTLTLIAAVGIGGAAALLRRRGTTADVVDLGVKSGLLMAAGVAGVVRWGQRAADAYAATLHSRPGDGDPRQYALVVHASATATAVGALAVAAVAVLAAALHASRGRAPGPGAASPPGGRLSRWRRVRAWLAGPAWALFLGACACCLVAAAAALPQVLPSSSGGQSQAVVALALPNAAAALLSIGSGTGLTVTDLADDGGLDTTTVTRVVHLSDLDRAWGPAWWVSAAFALIIALVGLTIAARCRRRPTDVHRSALTAGVLTAVGGAAWAALSGVTYELPAVLPHAQLSARVAVLRQGLWLGLLVMAATLLAGVVLPHLPPRLAGPLARLARRPGRAGEAEGPEDGGDAAGSPTAGSRTAGSTGAGPAHDDRTSRGGAESRELNDLAGLGPVAAVDLGEWSSGPPPDPPRT